MIPATWEAETGEPDFSWAMSACLVGVRPWLLSLGRKGEGRRRELVQKSWGRCGGGRSRRERHCSGRGCPSEEISGVAAWRPRHTLALEVMGSPGGLGHPKHLFSATWHHRRRAQGYTLPCRPLSPSGS